MTPLRRVIAFCGLLMIIGSPLTATAQETSEDYQVDAWQKFFYYFPSRVLDFADIFRAGVAFGPGFG